MLIEDFRWGPPAEGLAGSIVEAVLDTCQFLDPVQGQVGALGEVLAQQPVDASMSRGELAAGDVVLPRCLVSGHGPVDDVDEVAFEDAAGAATALGGLVAGQ